MATTEAQRPCTAAPPEPPEPAWLASLQPLLRELPGLPGLVSDRLELASVELQLAGRVLAQIVMLVVTAAILGVTAWLALWGGLLYAMIDAGLHWAAAVLLVLVLNLLACVAAVARARASAPRMRMSATWRHLGVPASTPAAA